MTKFGVAMSKCSAATPAIGPSGLCGATPMPALSAMAAIFRASRSPPQWQMSGWTMLMARSSNSARTPAARPAARLLRSGPTSCPRSLHQQRIARRHRLLDEQRPAWLQRVDVLRARRAADAGRPWKSTMISTPSPTASRSACHQLRHLVDRRARCRVVGVGDEHDLHRPVAALHHGAARARPAAPRSIVS